ncbi:MAG: class I SAM-dependent RNA methyltransferase [Pyrinomonadaceae bacterium]|nr:class I SAM-dependent RNA methyltransferase [Pyrinomonadaceae bacterium]
MKKRQRTGRALRQPRSNSSRRPEKAFEVLIERILPGGAGLAHADGQTFLVALAAPGDRLRVRIDHVRGKVAFASIEEIITPSPLRIEPPCPYFGRCGGCDFQQLSYQAQLTAKVEIIRDCLRRIARIEPPAEIHITPSPLAWHYRSRAQWQHDPRKGRLVISSAARIASAMSRIAPFSLPRCKRRSPTCADACKTGSSPPRQKSFRQSPVTATRRSRPPWMLWSTSLRRAAPSEITVIASAPTVSFRSITNCSHRWSPPPHTKRTAAQP